VNHCLQVYRLNERVPVEWHFNLQLGKNALNSRHRLLLHVIWHPLVAGIVLALMAYNISTRSVTNLRIAGLVLIGIWFLLALYRSLTSGHFLDFLYWLPGGEENEDSEPSEDEARAQLWYDHKSKLMERALGKEHDMVMHAIIPYAIGGTLDLYYYPKGIAETAIATKELSELPNEGSSNRVYKSYELVMFTRHPLSLDDAKTEDTPFGKAHRNINKVLNYIARYSAESSLNPHETCEFPEDFEGVGGKCLIFDGYACYSDDLADQFGLLAIIEVFRSEMDFARRNGGEALLQKLKDAGHYPYSDLDREPVV
jgi:hypothetical protein